MPAKLYAVAHSHPALAARLMLEHKGVDHEVWNILPGLHPQVVGLPAPRLAGWAYKPVIAYFARVVGADEETVRTDLKRLPELLDRTDALVAEGVIGGAEPNAADYQVLTSVRLLLAHEDLEPTVSRYRCAEAATRLVPTYAGPVPATIPAAWVR